MMEKKLKSLNGSLDPLGLDDLDMLYAYFMR